MSDICDPNHPFVRERHLAKRWGLSVKTLQRWRYNGVGPDYLKMNGSVLYPLAEAERFEARCLTKMGASPAGIGK